MQLFPTPRGLFIAFDDDTDMDMWLRFLEIHHMETPENDADLQSAFDKCQEWLGEQQ